MDYYITPSSNLNADIYVPGDKSISHRVAILSAISEGQTQVNGFLMGTDNLATVSALQKMGVPIKVIEDENVLLVDGVGKNGLTPAPDVIDCGNSGTALRLLAGLLAGQSFITTLTGDKSLKCRPMNRIINPLVRMGAKVESIEDMPPLKIIGNRNLKGIYYSLPIPSAQVKSCLLLAGLYAQTETCIVESLPSRDHTERLLTHFNYPVKVDNFRTRIPGGGILKARDITIPGDISSAAFFIVAATITPGSSLFLRRVGLNPKRLGIINLLKMMGGNIEILTYSEKDVEPVGDICVRHAKLIGIEIPREQVSLAIDEFPILLIAASVARGKTVLRGAEELRVKETDRIAAMEDGLQKLGVKLESFHDGLIIQGGTVFEGGTISSYEDHRIAMAFSIAGIVAKAPIRVNNCGNVKTSFPNFVELANEIGIEIKVL